MPQRKQSVRKKQDPARRKPPTDLQQLRASLKELKELAKKDEALWERQLYWKDRIETLKRSRSAPKRKQYREAIKAADAARKSFDKIQAKIDAQRLRVLRKQGLLKTSNAKLTSSKRRRISELWSKFGEQFDSTKYFIIAKPRNIRRSKAAIADFDEKAKGAGFIIGNDVVFMAKEGFKKASLRYDKRLGKFVVSREKQITRKEPGKKKRKLTIRQNIPLVGVDELLTQRDRLEKKINKMMPLKRNERLVFSISGNYSRRAFGSFERLYNYAMKYAKTAGAQMEFMKHIVIEKMTLEDWDNEIKEQDERYSSKRRRRRVNATGRNE